MPGTKAARLVRSSRTALSRGATGIHPGKGCSHTAAYEKFDARGEAVPRVALPLVFASLTTSTMRGLARTFPLGNFRDVSSLALDVSPPSRSCACAGAFDASVCNLIVDGDVNFDGNSAHNGGAVFLFQGVAHVSGGSFSGNAAGQSGGAMSISQPTDVRVHGVSFVSNTAEVGGAVALTSSGANPTELRDCTFESNTAVDGGALYMSTNEWTEIVHNCSFDGNNAGKLTKS